MSIKNMTPRLANTTQCTGCAACYNICRHNAITMAEDKEGFLFPVVNQDTCIGCGACEKCCPSLHDNILEAKTVKAYAMWSFKDRVVSSSGGAFSAFARFVISKGGVVFGAVFDEKMRLHHSMTDSLEGLKAMRGSKYVQSEIGRTMRQVSQALNEDRWVLFCGTPCQVDGLKRYLREKTSDKLITLDLACHGVPSIQVFQSYLEKLRKRFGKTEIVNYEFRKCDGWEKSPFVTFEGNNRIKIYGINALYTEAFNANALFRKSCYSCKYSSMNRMGDCTIADFWGIGRYGIPFRHDVMKGVSLVITNTAKGNRILHQLSDIFLEERNLKEALIENHNLKFPTPLHPKRDDIVSDFIRPDISLDEINIRYKLVDTSWKGKIKYLSDKLGLLNETKRIYNWYKTL